MKLPGSLKNRTSKEWGVRALLATVAGVLGYAVTVGSLAEALPDSQIELAHRLAPNNDQITAQLSRIRILADPSLSKIADEEGIASSALKRSAAAIPAITTLGFIAQAHGDLIKARRFFAYSDRLSRRDLITRIWLIEDAVSRGDTAAVLHHYDIALRTNISARDMLFPILATASSEPAVANALAYTLGERPAPPWKDAFLWFVGGNSGDPMATARLFTDLHWRKVSVPEAAQTALLNALIQARQYDAAWTYYALVHQRANRMRLRNPEFKNLVDTPSYLDWIPVDDNGGSSVTIQNSTHGGILDFSVPAGASGDLIKQLQLLPTGSYRLKGHSLNIDQTTGSLPYWVLRCSEDGRELGRVDVPNSAINEGIFTGQFTVPSNCPAQYLALVARTSDKLGGVSGQIDIVSLRRN